MSAMAAMVAIGVALVLIAVTAWLVHARRRATAAKIVASTSVALGEPFDWSPRTADAGPHALWLDLHLEFEGTEDTEGGLRLELQIDDAPVDRFHWNCPGQPHEYSMRAETGRFRADGQGTGSISALLEVCGLRARGPSVPVRLRGRVLPTATTRRGAFELRLARR